MNARCLFAALLPLLLSAPLFAQAAPPVEGPKTGASGDATLETLQLRVKQLEDEMREMRQNLQSLQNELKQKDDEINEILSALTERDSNSQPILALRSMMKGSGEFRKEMSQAVNESISGTGTLRVENQTSGVQFLSINGRSERIEPLATHTFTVPTGTLTTELTGQEGPKNWTIGPPSYQQEIIIRPRTQQTIVTSESVIVERPLYFLP